MGCSSSRVAAEAKLERAHVALKQQNAELREEIDSHVDHEKRRKLRELDLLVLDNSLRESTVGQVIGHNLEDKLAILDAVESVGIEFKVIAAFSSGRRVDDVLAKELQARGGDMSNYFAFTEDSDSVTADGKMRWGEDCVPVAMRKMEEFGVPNPIIEIDLDDASVDWEGAFPVAELLRMTAFLLTHARDRLGCRGRALINIRDWPFVMMHHPHRLLEFVQGVAALPGGASDGIRPMGLMIEEPTGLFFSTECARWTRWLRNAMSGWSGARLLTHVHKQWGLADGVVLDMLAAGCDGIWCSLAEEGAAMGHACSAVTIANLARLGNKHVLERFHCTHLAEAARAVTRRTTGKGPDQRQIVYGPRAVEVVFDFAGIGGAAVAFDTDGDGKIDEVDTFNLSKFLGLPKPPVRITSLASAGLIVRHLRDTFGDNAQFTVELAGRMQEMMTQDLIDEHKQEEYSSPTGLAKLCASVGVKLTPSMIEACERAEGAFGDEGVSGLGARLLVEAQQSFHDASHGRDTMDRGTFYAYFLQPYLGCFACDTSRVMIDTIVDVDVDGNIEWKEWRFWLMWAVRHQDAHEDEINDLDKLYHFVFRNALLPATLAQFDVQKIQAAPVVVGEENPLAHQKALIMSLKGARHPFAFVAASAQQVRK
ncbi:hypothetical protein M885DRAFT_510424 [Pelagophyceae sp. CCMP2097]|nr:hypothetical protein M885DRAFT_510424 [Pelagophyceae sp. CCMP2097]